MLLLSGSHRVFKHANQGFHFQIMTKWLLNAWNKYDADRVKEVGVEVGCAEWLLKNGAHVKWDKFEQKVGDFNKLSSGAFNSCHIKEILANESSIHVDGFQYMEKLPSLEAIRLHKCMYIDDNALQFIANHYATSLKSLEVIGCYCVTSTGLKSLEKMKGLRDLKMANIGVHVDLEEVKADLEPKLPDCTIVTDISSIPQWWNK